MPLPEYFTFQTRTKIVFGENVLDQVGTEAELLGGTKAIIVTDKIVRGLGFADRIKQSLEDAGLEVVDIFDDVPVDSDLEVCKKLYETAKSKGADITIAHGGGSVIDTAKGANILLTEGGDLREDHQGAYLLTRPLKPMIAVPTTAGTGSEITFAAVIKDNEDNLKLSFVSEYMGPDVAVLDPEVTMKMPPGLTAGTGMDALTHCIETLVSTMSDPVTDALALGGIRMISENLRTAVNQGDDVDARGNMLIAATIAGLAFANSLCGIVHAISHSVGATSHVPHGVANAILLPWCMEYNLDFCEKEYAQAAHAMGVPDSGDARADALMGIEEVRRLNADIGMPPTLSAVGVKEEDLVHISEISMGDGSMVTNPRPVEDDAEVLDILKKCF